MLRYIVTICLLCFSWLAAEASDDAAPWCSIEALVSDGLGSPVEGAEVVADSTVLFGKRRGLTGESGRFVLRSLRPGVFKVEIGRDGYQWVEIEEVVCHPGATVRLTVVLEAVDYEEVVVLGAGPVLDAGSTTVRHFRSEAATRRLPDKAAPEDFSLVVDGMAGFVTLPPDSARAWTGEVVSGSSSPHVTMTTRPLEEGVFGRIEVEGSVGSSADPVSARGRAVELDGAGRVGMSIGVQAGSGRIRWFVAAGGERRELNHSSELNGQDGAAPFIRSHDWIDEIMTGFGTFRLALSPSNELDFRWYGGSESWDQRPSTLFVAIGSPTPMIDRKVTNNVMRLGLGGVRGESLAYRLTAVYGSGKDDLEPLQFGMPGQDLTAEGTFSGGIGNGAWYSTGGLAVTREDDDAQQLSADLEWQVARDHTVQLAATWRETDRVIELASASAGREYRMGDGSSWTDSLAQRPQSCASWREVGVEIGDRWRVASSVTLSAGVGVREVEFKTDLEGRGYRFGFEDTLSPHLGLAWDFEANGRSRLWAAWRRWRPDLERVVRTRLMGSLEVESVFFDPESGLEYRHPGPVEVDSDLEPAQHEQMELGVEYEVLSRLVVGAAMVHRRVRDEVATLSTDGGGSYIVQSPSGSAWPETLWSDRWQGLLWAKKQLSAGWQAEVHLEWSQSTGTWAGSASTDMAAIDREWLRDVVVPEVLVDAAGPLPDDRRWEFRALGSWTVGPGVVVGGRLTYSSGAPVSMLGAVADGFGLDRRFVDARGEGGRSPSLWQLDGLVVWPFELKHGVVEARFEVLNLFDQQRAVAVDERWSLLDENDAAGLDAAQQRTSETWGATLRTQSPRQFCLGFAYSW